MMCCVPLDVEAKEPYNVEIRIKDRLNPKKTTTMHLPMILPHEMLHHLHCTGKIQIDPMQVQTYWQRYRDFKDANHPCCKDGLLKHSPLGLAGDDCKYTLAGSKVIIIAFNLPLHDRQKKQKTLYDDPDTGHHKCIHLFSL